MKTYYFNSGCALTLYKPHAETKLLEILQGILGDVKMHNICCRHDPMLPADSTIINVCAGCDKRFGSLYEGIDTISLWEVLETACAYPFPDYNGREVSLHDPCPVRTNPKVHEAVRTLLEKMNLTLHEPARNGEKSVCCGDSLYKAVPLEEVYGKMRERAAQMPCEDVVVYCVSCIKAMDIGKRHPLHLVDLLLGEQTQFPAWGLEEYHDLLEDYIAVH